MTSDGEVAVYKVSPDSRGPKVTLHRKACEAAGLEPGDHVRVYADEGELRLERVDGEVRRIGGTLVIGESYSDNGFTGPEADG